MLGQSDVTSTRYTPISEPREAERPSRSLSAFYFQYRCPTKSIDLCGSEAPQSLSHADSALNFAPNS